MKVERAKQIVKLAMTIENLERDLQATDKFFGFGQIMYASPLSVSRMHEYKEEINSIINDFIKLKISELKKELELL